MPVVIFITASMFFKNRQKFSFNFFIVFLVYLLISLVVEISSNIIAFYDLNNLVIYNVEMLIETLAFCYLFYSIDLLAFARKLLFASILFFVLFWIINFLFIQRVKTLDTYSYLLSCLILCMFSMITIYQYIFQSAFGNPFHNFFFWASIGILFCYLGNIPYLASYNILVIKDKITAYSLGIISQIVNTILYLMLITGIVCHRPQKILELQ